MSIRNNFQLREISAAIQDLEGRSLAGIPEEFGRLVFLASTRDYNTGRYYHEGLATQFTEEIAGRALVSCHQETFDRLVSRSLEDFLHELEAYLRSTGEPPAEVLEAWRKLEPYRVTIPAECDSLSAALFFSNVKTALAILKTRRGQSGQTIQDPYQPTVDSKRWQSRVEDVN